LIIFLKQGLVLSREETHDIASSGSSMTWSMCHSHRNLLLPAS
jgi:hypothetical protein